MQLSVSRSALLKVLAGVARIVERRNTIPILTHVKLTAADGRLSVYGTDLDIQAEGGCEATIEAPGLTTVGATLLHDIVRKLPDGAIRLDLQAAGLIVRAGRSRFTLQVLPAEDFPDLAVGEMPNRFTIPGRELTRLIEPAQFAMSTEETRYYLNGVYLHALADEPKLRAVATDGHRLARITSVEGVDGISGLPGVIVPRKTVAEILRLLKDHSDETHGVVPVELSAQKIRLRVADFTLTSKLIDGTFPDYQRVIPAGNDRPLIVDTEALIAAVERVSAVFGESGRAIRLQLDDGRLVLSGRDLKAGESEDELEVEWDHGPFEIGFNAKYLAEILAQTGGDTTLIRFGEAQAPTLFQARESAPGLFVLMPMRV